MMTHNEMIAVIAHHRDGGKVECTTRNGFFWVDATHLGLAGFDFSEFDYRPKPEPMTVWLVCVGNHESFAAFPSEEAATNHSLGYVIKPTIKKFIEAP
jgi:hypothetical protein